MKQAMPWQRAFILHSKPYTESSLLLDVFTEQYGLVKLLSKGARSKRSNLKGILQPFTPLLIRWVGNGSIKTLTGAEAISLALPLFNHYLYCGLYVNELILRVLEENTDAQTLFFDYLACIQELATQELPMEAILRTFELALLKHLGYGVDFLHCAGSGEEVSDEMTYQYRLEKGFIASLVINHHSFTGKQLKALAYRDFKTADELQAAKRFTRIALKPYLGSKPLKSRELFLQYRPKT